MFISLWRVVHFAFQNFIRNFWLSMVTMTIMVLAFLSVNFFLLANIFFDTALSTIEEKVNITVFFKPSAQESDITALLDRLKSHPDVKNVDYVTKDQALQRLKERYQDAGSTLIQDALKELDENPLSGNIVIQTKELGKYGAVQDILNESEYQTFIERKNIDDRTLLIAKISQLRYNVKQVGIAANGFFALVIVMIIFNTIRITIHTRRKEIGIMKLVGATNWFIRAPMVLESMLSCAVSLAIAIVILYPILGAMQPYAARFFDGSALDIMGYFSNNFFIVFGYQLLAGLALCMISASIAVGRYLKV